jgi:hypothetical protein
VLNISYGKANQMPKITVVIEKGVVQAVDCIPVDISVEVLNYDIQGVDPNFVAKDEKGRVCQIREWHAPE